MAKLGLTCKLFLGIIFILAISAEDIKPDCSWRVFVNDEVVIDAPLHEDCLWEFETEEDRIIVVTAVNGNLIEAQQHFSIHDGIGSDSPILLVENQKIHKASRKDLPHSVYTTEPKASIRFKDTLATDLQLKIQKAISCPFNLGPDSQCGRVVDEVSCYCATFTDRVQTDQTMYCVDNNMKLISFENATEEQLIQTAWGIQQEYWTSLTDTRRDETWIWESSMTVAVYTNWYPGKPNTAAGNNDDCMVYGGTRFLGFWGDSTCGTMAHAVCEAHP